MAKRRPTKSTPVLYGMGEFQEPGEGLHVLRGEFLIKASVLYPAVLTELTPIATLYGQIYEEDQRLFNPLGFRGGILHPSRNLLKYASR